MEEEVRGNQARDWPWFAWSGWSDSEWWLSFRKTGNGYGQDYGMFYGKTSGEPHGCGMSGLESGNGISEAEKGRWRKR